MLKIRSDARAWQFTGDMFSAVDIIRAMEYERGDRMAPVFHEQTKRLSVYCPVADCWYDVTNGDWIVKTEGSRILVYAPAAFVFAFNEDTAETSLPTSGSMRVNSHGISFSAADLHIINEGLKSAWHHAVEGSTMATSWKRIIDKIAAHI